jgi:factor associated with neutral sphingomyelinase activation
MKGKLHLCSRSLVFEPKGIDLPLIKIKYSNNINIKLLKNINSAKLKVLLTTNMTPS